MTVVRARFAAKFLLWTSHSGVDLSPLHTPLSAPGILSPGEIYEGSGHSDE